MAIDVNKPNIYHTDNAASPIKALFLNVINPRATKRNGKEVGDPRFDILVAFEPDSSDFLAIKALTVQIALAKWPGRKLGEQSKTGDFAFPFTDGTKAADRAKLKGKDMEAARGKILLKAKSKFRPSLNYIGPTGEVVALYDDEQAIKAAANKFYRGVEVGLSLEFNAYEGTQTDTQNIPDGVSVYLQKVLSLNRGERLQGQGRSSAEAFKGYAGKVSDEDPTAGMDLDDEIAF